MWKDEQKLITTLQHDGVRESRKWEGRWKWAQNEIQSLEGGFRSLPRPLFWLSTAVSLPARVSHLAPTPGNLTKSFS